MLCTVRVYIVSRLVSNGSTWDSIFCIYILVNSCPSGTSAKTLTTLQYEKQPLTVVFNSVLSQVTTDKADLIAEAIFRAVTSRFLVCVPGGEKEEVALLRFCYVYCLHACVVIRRF